MAVKRFEVYLVELDPTRGSEIKKTRPAAVVSPDEMNAPLRTVIIAPMTTKGRVYPSRVPCSFNGRERQVVCDQLRTVDKVRLVKKLGTLSPETQQEVTGVLQEMFAF